MDISSFLSAWYRLVIDKFAPREGICNSCRHFVHYLPFKRGDTWNGIQIPMKDEKIHYICPVCQVELD